MSLVYLQYVVLDSAYSYVSAEAWAKERSSDMTVQVLADSAKDDFCRLRINTSDSDVDVKIYKLAKPIVLPETENECIKLFSQYDEKYLSGHGRVLSKKTPLQEDFIPDSKELFLVAVASITSGYACSLRPAAQEEYTRPPRETILAAARRRKPPSTGATNSVLSVTQVSDRSDAMYNYRPLSLTPPPIFIYHPVFRKFVDLMATPTEEIDFSHQELDLAYNFIKVSLDFYPEETNRQHKLEDLKIISSTFWRVQQLRIDDNHYIKPDGLTDVECIRLPGGPTAFSSLDELKNGNGEGNSDAINQAECTYIAICASDGYKYIRKVSPCPSFLIGLQGSSLAVSGAVFADNFISQRLTHYIFLGPVATVTVKQSPLDCSIREAAKIIRFLKICLDDLEDYYRNLEELAPPPRQMTYKSRLPSQRTGRPNSNSRSKQPPLPQIFPFWTAFSVGDKPYVLNYTGRLVSGEPAKAVFKASMQYDDSEGKELRSRLVVVKFTHSYGREGHELLARHSPPLAPKLWYCERVETIGMYAVVMDYVEGHDIFDDPLTPTAAEALRTAVQTLHNENLVFGDLRTPNVIQVKNAEDSSKDGIMLIDFDWCGEQGQARYPSDINLGPDIDWHEEVCRGGLITKEHDQYMLRNITS